MKQPAYAILLRSQYAALQKVRHTRYMKPNVMYRNPDGEELRIWQKVPQGIHSQLVQIVEDQPDGKVDNQSQKADQAL